MEVFAVRQPIFNHEAEVVGCAVRFRAPFEEYYAALEAAGGEDLAGLLTLGQLAHDQPAFLSFPRELLTMRFPVLLPAERIVTEVSAGLGEDEEIVSFCAEMKELGYRLAVTDVTAKTAAGPLVALADLAIADLVGTPVDLIGRLPALLGEADVLCILRGVDTPQDFEEGRQWGYAQLQGEFFAKPVLKPGRQLSTSKLAYLRLLREVNSPTLSYNELAEIIEQDVAMTYKLLRFMNSAWFGLRFEVNSVKHALVLLGPKEIKRWASMIAIRSTADDKPHELMVRCLTRAKAAEQIALRVGKQKEASELFLMGMFSIIDAILDQPLANALRELPLKEDIRNPLLGRDSPYRPVYDTVLAYERGDWATVGEQAGSMRLREDDLPVILRASDQWAREALREM